jgi:uncharacterized protein
MTVALLVAVAFVTAIVSAIIGMGGGILLLATLVSFLPPIVAIPLHGVIQIASNGSRVVVQRRHIQMGIAAPFAILVLPGAVIGYVALTSVPASVASMALGVFILGAVWIRMPAPTRPRSVFRRFLLLGGAAGVANTSVGSSGPLIAPFFLGLGLTRHQIIGSKAACQAQGHLAKIIVFGMAGFAWSDYSLLLGLTVLAVVGGTVVGSRILDRVNERTFVVLYKVTLTLIAIRMVLIQIV